MSIAPVDRSESEKSLPDGVTGVFTVKNMGRMEIGSVIHINGADLPSNKEALKQHKVM